ncbi:MAG: hypothetical protein ACLR1M_08805 [Oscillospiraceae bacterium]
MGKQKMTPIGIACILLVLLVVAFMVRRSLREPEKIVLPPEPSTTEPSGPTVDNEAVDRVEVRPDTVQSAIEVLARPRVYTRTITVERYWSGGSGVSVITAAAADGWLRLDVTETDGQTRHVITGDDAVYIWYGSSRKVYSGASALTQDAEQGILTYEGYPRAAAGAHRGGGLPRAQGCELHLCGDRARRGGLCRALLGQRKLGTACRGGARMRRRGRLPHGGADGQLRRRGRGGFHPAERHSAL